MPTKAATRKITKHEPLQQITNRNTADTPDAPQTLTSRAAEVFLRLCSIDEQKSILLISLFGDGGGEGEQKDVSEEKQPGSLEEYLAASERLAGRINDTLATIITRVRM